MEKIDGHKLQAWCSYECLKKTFKWSTIFLRKFQNPDGTSVHVCAHENYYNDLNHEKIFRENYPNATPIDCLPSDDPLFGKVPSLFKSETCTVCRSYSLASDFKCILCDNSYHVACLGKLSNYGVSLCICNRKECKPIHDKSETILMLINSISQESLDSNALAMFRTMVHSQVKLFTENRLCVKEDMMLVYNKIKELSPIDLGKLSSE